MNAYVIIVNYSWNQEMPTFERLFKYINTSILLSLNAELHHPQQWKIKTCNRWRDSGSSPQRWFLTPLFWDERKMEELLVCMRSYERIWTDGRTWLHVMRESMNSDRNIEMIGTRGYPLSLSLGDASWTGSWWMFLPIGLIRLDQTR